jgi:hypothetical protein
MFIQCSECGVLCRVSCRCPLISRKEAEDKDVVFGCSKLGDLSGDRSTEVHEDSWLSKHCAGRYLRSNALLTLSLIAAQSGNSNRLTTVFEAWSYKSSSMNLTSIRYENTDSLDGLSIVASFAETSSMALCWYPSGFTPTTRPNFWLNCSAFFGGALIIEMCNLPY